MAVFSGLTPAEADRAAHLQASVNFPILLPGSLPFGYRLVSVKTVEHAGDLAIMAFRGPWGRSFRLTERIATLALRTELAGAGIPYRTVLYRGRDFAVIRGEFVGEPVDLWHWHDTRDAVAWEQDGLICEIGVIRAHGPGLSRCLRIASSLRSVAQVRPTLTLSAKGVDIAR
jgi:hypothetical protein